MAPAPTVPRPRSDREHQRADGSAVPVDDGGRHLGPCLPRAGMDPRQVDAVTVGDGGIVRNHEHLSAVGGQVTRTVSFCTRAETRPCR